MIKIKNGIIAAVDVGTTKAVAAIAQYDFSLKTLRLIGTGYHPNQGMKAGEVIDMDAVEDAVLHAVHVAEQNAGETIDQVIVNISGTHLMSEKVEVNLSVSGHEIDDHDMEKILDRETLLKGAKGFDIIHLLPLGYRIDDHHQVRDPRGMIGSKLAGTLHVITGSSTPIRSLVSSIRRTHLNTLGMCATPIASGIACLTEDEMNMGVTVIDVGGGLTHIAQFHEGRPVHIDVVPIGGRHITNDITRGLTTTFSHAERLKILHGAAMMTPDDQKHGITVPRLGEDHNIYAKQESLRVLTAIIEPRLEELFEIVRLRLEKNHVSRVAGRRFVLTGGTSHMPGIRELSSRILNNQVRLGRPLSIQGTSEISSGGAFATCAGLLLFGLNEKTQTSRNQKSGFFQKTKSWIEENF